MNTQLSSKVNHKKNVFFAFVGMVAGLILVLGIGLVRPALADTGSPVCSVNSAGQSTSPSIHLDLGAGYMLVENCNEWSIVAPASLVKFSAPAIASVQKWMDIGDGYSLVTDADGTHIVAPPSLVKSYALPATVEHKTIDIGAGYTLVTDENGTRIVAPSKVQPQDQTVQADPATLRKIDIGDGYELQLWAGGGQIVKVSP